MNNLRFYFLTLAVIFRLSLSARDIYIAPDGNDLNPGTQTQPLYSLNGARDLIRQYRATGILNEEIHVIVADGTYYMTEPLLLNELDSGNEKAPVIFKAGEGAKPVFVGGIPISNWEKVSDKLWKARVPEVKHFGLYFEQLYINGQRAVRAKSPNQGFYFLKGADETVVSQVKGKVPEMAVQVLKLFPEAASDFNHFSANDFNDAILTFYHKWDNTRKRISAFDADSSFVFTSGKGMKPWNKLDKKTRFLIENYHAGLDTCGEWFLERNGDLYYIPNEGEKMEGLRAIAPVIDRFIVIRGNQQSGKQVSNIRFENLRFEVASYHTPQWGNEAVQAAATVEAVVMVDYADHIDFYNCEIAHTGTNGFWIRKACTDCSVQHCYLYDLGAGGIKIGDISIPVKDSELTKRINVDNNIIRSGGYIFPCAVGVTVFQASDNTITHNEIAYFRYSGVSVGWVWGYSYSPSKRNTINYNHIHHLGWGELCDMGGVYCLGASEGTTVSNNVIHHVYSFDYGGWGLYTDEGSTGILMENNLVYACKNSAFHQHYGKENTVRNNIFAANLKAQLQATRIEEHLSFNFTNNIVWFNSGTLLSSRWSQVKINSDQNCYWDTRTKDIRFDKLSLKEWKASGKDQKSIIANPEFTNPEAFDFRMNNKALMKKIGFKPFDYSKAGVYGSADWVGLSVSDPLLDKKYDTTIYKLENRN